MTGGGLKLDFAASDVPDSSSGMGFTIASTGRLTTVEGDMGVRQAIMVLLATVPGERVMRPDYGCDLHRLAFAPNDATTAGLAIHYVRQALERWEPRVELLQLDAGAPGGGTDESRLHISLDYRVRTTGRTARLEAAVDLQGGSH